MLREGLTLEGVLQHEVFGLSARTEQPQRQRQFEVRHGGVRLGLFHRKKHITAGLRPVDLVRGKSFAGIPVGKKAVELFARDRFEVGLQVGGAGVPVRQCGVVEVVAHTGEKRGVAANPAQLVQHHRAFGIREPTAENTAHARGVVHPHRAAGLRGDLCDALPFELLPVLGGDALVAQAAEVGGKSFV